MKNINFDFLKPTIIFSVIGIFIPGFTAMGLVGTQMLLSSVGIECTVAWKLIWTSTIILGIVSPVIFIKYIRNITDEKIKDFENEINNI